MNALMQAAKSIASSSMSTEVHCLQTHAALPGRALLWCKDSLKSHNEEQRAAARGPQSREMKEGAEGDAVNC